MNTHDLEDLPVLRTSLEDLAERIAPPSAVDVRAARRVGERAKARRTAGRLTAVAAVVAAGVLCVTVLPSALRPAPGGPDGGQAATPTGPPETIALVPGSDPYYLSAAFGWLPAGYGQGAGFSIQGTSAYLNSGTPPTQPPGTAVAASSVSQYMIQISRQPLGWGGFHFSSLPDSSTVTINGPSATLLLGASTDFAVTQSTGAASTAPPPDQILGVLTWQMENGYYAQLTATSPAGTPDVASTILHIARTFKVTPDPTRLPFYLRNLPTSLGVVDILGGAPAPASTKNDVWGMGLEVGVSEESSFGIDVSTQGAPSGMPYIPAGDQACKTQSGLQICVYKIGGSPLPAPVAKLGLNGLLNDIVGLGTDPAGWTTDVIR